MAARKVVGTRVWYYNDCIRRLGITRGRLKSAEVSQGGCHKDWYDQGLRRVSGRRVGLRRLGITRGPLPKAGDTTRVGFKDAKASAGSCR